MTSTPRSRVGVVGIAIPELRDAVVGLAKDPDGYTIELIGT